MHAYVILFVRPGLKAETQGFFCDYRYILYRMLTPERQWSCSTLLRGSSFLAEQMAANKKMSYDQIVAVSRLLHISCVSNRILLFILLRTRVRTTAQAARQRLQTLADQKHEQPASASEAKGVAPGGKGSSVPIVLSPTPAMTPVTPTAPAVGGKAALEDKERSFPNTTL